MADRTWLDRRIIAYAHQGGAREAPSSTLFAISQALANGATAIELDVHATLDGELVVCHDPTLERTTNGTGEIAAHTLDELGRLDNAYWFVPGEEAVWGRPEDEYRLRGRAPDDHELGIATLKEVLERFPGIVLNLDIKRSAPHVPPYEEALARVLREYERRDEVIVASFLDHATEAFSRYAPEIAISAGTNTTTDFYWRLHAGSPPPDGIERFVALQVPPNFGDLVVVDERFLDAAHRAGLAVHVWTIDDPLEMDRLAALGVDGIISDRPSALVEVLNGRKAAWVP